eukprot:SM000020S06026  [mRNA]  locus=s20:584024:587236:+ [translate_table: standard]
METVPSFACAISWKMNMMKSGNCLRNCPPLTSPGGVTQASRTHPFTAGSAMLAVDPHNYYKHILQPIILSAPTSLDDGASLQIVVDLMSANVALGGKQSIAVYDTGFGTHANTTGQRLVRCVYTVASQAPVEIFKPMAFLSSSLAYNLYPILHLLPSGNFFFVAETQACEVNFLVSGNCIRTFPNITQLSARQHLAGTPTWPLNIGAANPVLTLYLIDASLPVGHVGRSTVLNSSRLDPTFDLACLAPSSSSLLPPGFYLLFVTVTLAPGAPLVPSKATWVQIEVHKAPTPPPQPPKSSPPAPKVPPPSDG